MTGIRLANQTCAGTRGLREEMQLKTIQSVLFACAILLGGCAPISTNFDYDVNWDYDSLKTYQLLTPPATSEINSLSRDRVTNAINSEFIARGYSEVDADSDFLVAYHAGSQDKIEVSDWGYAYGGRGSYYGYGGRRTAVDVYQYQEGSLIIDIVDTETHKLIWRGTARKVLDTNPTPEQRTATVNAAVAKILEGFPPKK
jgi:hypothetical protein